jgi:hypothetical protein
MQGARREKAHIFKALTDAFAEPLSLQGYVLASVGAIESIVPEDALTVDRKQ